jgi:hypothetical protein
MNEDAEARRKKDGPFRNPDCGIPDQKAPR